MPALNPQERHLRDLLQAWLAQEIDSASSSLATGALLIEPDPSVIAVKYAQLAARIAALRDVSAELAEIENLLAGR